MQLELSELDRRYEGLRIADPGRHARLSVALAREGQQSPVLVVGDGEQWVLVDGYCRVAALEQLGEDVVEAAWIGETTPRSSAPHEGRRGSALRDQPRASRDEEQVRSVHGVAPVAEDRP